MFHALVCYSKGANGWKLTPQTATQCLDASNVPNNEDITIVPIGEGIIGQKNEADVSAIPDRNYLEDAFRHSRQNRRRIFQDRRILLSHQWRDARYFAG